MSEATAICSKCGYDLRGIASDRCPECGFELANQVLLGGEIPWTYRRVRGRVRTFVETVNKVGVGGPWLARVIAGPVSLTDARRFWFITATITSLPLIAAFVYAWVRSGDLVFTMYLPDPLTPAAWNVFGVRATAFRAAVPAWIKTELLWPISAGLSRPGVAIGLLWLLILLASGAPTYLFHPRHLSEAQRHRANAFSYYLCAPLVWATPLLIIVAAAIIYAIEKQRSLFRTPTYVAVLAGITWMIVMALWYARLLKTFRLTTHAELPRTLAAAVLIPVMWIACTIFALMFVPWCIGTMWLLVEALR